MPSFDTAYIPPRTVFRCRGSMSSAGAASTGTSTPPILRTSRGFSATPEAIRET